MKKKKICILSFSNIAWDSRVLREINMARKHYHVSVIGYGKWSPPKDVAYFPLQRMNVLPLRKYFLLIAGLINKKFFDRYFWLKKSYKQALQILQEGNFDLIHANDWDSLPIVDKYCQSSKSKTLFDAHEYSLAKISNSIVFRKLIIPYRDYLFSRYCRNISGMITVSEGIKNLYKEKYDWDMKVILNAPEYKKFEFNKTDPENIWIVHHGGAMPARRLEKIINTIPHLREEFKLAFFLLPTYPRYYQKIKKIASVIAGDRIVFNEPTEPENVVSTLSQFDIGIHFLEGNQLNHINALPNKIFDFMMAGLTLAINPLPMMKKIVVENDVGILLNGETPEEFASTINSLLPEQIDEYKKNSLSAAKRINANEEMKKLRSYYELLLDGKVL